MKIHLAEMDKLLFPEKYPFYKESFREDLIMLGRKCIDDQNLLTAIAFKVRLTKLSMKIKPEIRESIRYIFEDFMARIYDWNQP